MKQHVPRNCSIFSMMVMGKLGSRLCILWTWAMIWTSGQPGKAMQQGSESTNTSRVLEGKRPSQLAGLSQVLLGGIEDLRDISDAPLLKRHHHRLYWCQQEHSAVGLGGQTYRLLLVQ